MLRRLHDDLHVTTVFVTHDQEEALELADRVVIMNHGHVEQIGTPEAVYERPATPFVFDFLGGVNVFGVRVITGTFTWATCPSHCLAWAGPGPWGPRVYVRPHLFDVHARSTATRRSSRVSCTSAAPDLW